MDLLIYSLLYVLYGFCMQTALCDAVNILRIVIVIALKGLPAS